ncbi:MAG: HlyD family secretion protein [Bacteroidaceae bacterium]|nr:HlyD family secretion protein [Bacteroidaceae bacterium]
MEKKQIYRWAYNLIVLALLITGATIVILNFAHFGNVEWTDNAHVRQHITPVNTRVQGFIKEVRFEEFQPVHKGDTLVIIEDAEFRLALAQAEASLANAEAGSRATTTGMATTQSNIGVTDATIEELRAMMENAQREDARFQRLFADKSVTQQQADNIHTAYVAACARYEAASRERRSMTLVHSEQGHRLKQSEANIEVARAQLNLARLNLSYTAIVATADGVLGRKEIHEGQLVQPGQTMVDIVDGQDLWVVANYRETQLPNIAVGAKVRIRADAVPDVEYAGVVERISDATGSAYSLIPQDNATGNFVKVEQRVPVRISFEGNKQEDLAKLRAGLNVECEILY